MIRAGAPPGGAHFIPDEDFLRLKRLLIARTGHFYYQDKDSLLWERLRRRLEETGLSGSGAYLERLSDAALGEAEWAALEAEITIGETFFFRYAEQFAALRDTILPDILARQGSRRQLRLWSAGCANGAEPYSVAILLRQLLGNALPEWRVALLGTDLNEAALQQARRALYSRWALRGRPPEEVERDFTPAEAGRRWALRPQHRAMVRFQRHNLLSLLDGTAPLELNEFDLILCRNVLIYFHPDLVEALVRALGERLRSGGWLLLGHAEPNPAFARYLDVVELPGTVAYRRRDSAPWPAQVRPQAAGLAAPAPAGPALAPLPAFRPQPPPMPVLPVAAAPAAVPAAAAADAASLRAAARQAADQDDLVRAAAACQQALQILPMDPVLHYLQGLVERMRGRPCAAEAALRRAIYLRGDFAMAHYQLGLLMLDEGRLPAGRRALAAAARIAHALPPEGLLEEGDGMTARQLRAGVRVQLEALAPGDC